MSDFLDSSFSAGGKRYAINLTDWDARELRALGFNVYALADDWLSDENLPNVNVMLGMGELFIDVLLYVCKPESEEAFLKALDNEARDAAREAFKNAIVNFFPADSRSSISARYSGMVDLMNHHAKLIQDPESTSLPANSDSIPADTVTGELLNAG